MTNRKTGAATLVCGACTIVVASIFLPWFTLNASSVGLPGSTSFLTVTASSTLTDIGGWRFAIPVLAFVLAIYVAQLFTSAQRPFGHDFDPRIPIAIAVVNLVLMGAAAIDRVNGLSVGQTGWSYGAALGALGAVAAVGGAVVLRNA